MRIYLIRHGETDWNRDLRFQGRQNIPLNDNGRAQAGAAAEALRKIPLDLIAVSPLDRAQETARIIAQHHADTPFITDPDLIERDYGLLSGLHKQALEQFQAEGRPTLAEPLEELCLRAFHTIQKYAQLPHEHILLVTHGAWINALVAHLTNFTMGSNKTWLKNGGITIVDEDLKLLYYNLDPEEFVF